MRRALIMIVGLFVLLGWVSIPGVEAAQSADWLGLEQLDRGMIAIRYDVKDGVKTKLIVAKDQSQYTYVLSANKPQEVFPLQMGNGDYTVTVLEQVSGTKYQIIHKAVVPLQLENDSRVFLNSIQNVNWSEGDKPIQLAKKLTRSAQSDEERVQTIYEYIIGAIRYDKSLASSKLTDYLPDINRTMTGKKGICYDYASLFASMLRSIGIPTKLVMGTSQYVDVYHAWNEVYLNGKWVTVDTTVDAGWKASKSEFQMMKDASQYSAAKYY